MNTRELATEYRLSHWAEVMRERNESGLSVKAYCENAGIHEKVYYYWQRKLREAACGELTVMRNKTVQTGLSTAVFAEVRMAEASAEPVQPEAEQSSQLRVEIGGIQISADSAYPTEKLAALLRELTRIC